MHTKKEFLDLIYDCHDFISDESIFLSSFSNEELKENGYCYGVNNIIFALERAYNMLDSCLKESKEFVNSDRQDSNTISNFGGSNI